MRIGVRITRSYAGSGLQYDLTPYLPDDDPLLVEMERERLRFEWTMDSLNLKVSNIGGQMEAILGAIAGTTDEWIIHVLSDDDSGTFKEFWRGIIENDTVELSIDSKWIELDAFSLNRWVWDRLKEWKARPLSTLPYDTDTAKNESFVKLSYWLDKFVIGNQEAYPILHTPFVWPAPLKEKRWIVGKVVVDPAVDVEWKMQGFADRVGSMVDLDPNLTMADFLLEVLKWANAEMYVDESGVMQVKTREGYSGSTVKDLTGKIREDREPVIRFNDNLSIDKLRVWVPVVGPPPRLLSYETRNWSSASNVDANGYLKRGTYYYRLQWYDSADNVLFESIDIEWKTPDLGPGIGFRPTLYLPAGPSGTQVVKRKLWRSVPIYDKWHRLVGVIENNDAIDDWIDTVSVQAALNDTGSPPMPLIVTKAATALIKFDNGWLTPELNWELTSTGKVFDARPLIQFTDPNNIEDIKPVNAEAVLKFFRQNFGQEMNLDWYKTRYPNLFAIEKAISVMVRGVDYPVGTRVRAEKDLRLAKYGDMIIRKAAVNFKGREATLSVSAVPEW